MAAETEKLKASVLNELIDLKMGRHETVDAFINRAEALRNQCKQLGKDIEEFELKMYILRGLRPEFDSNVRVFEMQRNISVFDIRFALKQEIQRRERRKKERQSRDRESVRKVEGQKGNIYCYNCGTKGHMAAECNRNKRCFNCQRFNHIAAECREPRRNQPPVGRGQERNFQMGIRGRITRQHVGRSEIAMKTSDEAVISVKEIMPTDCLS